MTRSTANYPYFFENMSKKLVWAYGGGNSSTGLQKKCLELAGSKKKRHFWPERDRGIVKTARPHGLFSNRSSGVYFDQGGNGHARVRSASVSLNPIVRPASGPRPLPFLPQYVFGKIGTRSFQRRAMPGPPYVHPRAWGCRSFRGTCGGPAPPPPPQGTRGRGVWPPPPDVGRLEMAAFDLSQARRWGTARNRTCTVPSLNSARLRRAEDPLQIWV
eukprot:gene8843-biopygen7654